MTSKPARRWPIVLLLGALLLVPALFWRQVWFGSHLSDQEIRQRLVRVDKPRDLQHACEQISKWMQRDPQGARQFYPLLVPLAGHPDDSVRSAVAWCMGEDAGRFRLFHEALLGLAADGAPRVRYNAALALTRFEDPAARPVLRKMLAPSAAIAQWTGEATEGVVVDILRPRDPVRPLTQLALVDTGQGERKPVLAPLGGRIDRVRVRLGDRITAGESLCTIEPDFEQVYAALRALALVGEPTDAEAVERYLDPDQRFSQSERAYLATQARLTAGAIEKRDSASAGRRSRTQDLR
jgi:biotin carboxyl carrier protein